MSNQNITPEFKSLLKYIKENRGFDFSNYKPSTLIRRIQKRIQAIGINNYSDYIDYLEVHPDEFGHLFNTILINVTAFFRDRAAWDYIAAEIVPQILANKRQGEPIRIWSAGCASGQETYTLAMVLAEAVGFEIFKQRVKIFATDMDEEALSQARQACYTQQEVADIPPQLLEKYFELQGTHYVFNKELRRSIIFGRHNLIKDAPIARIDLLVCRNTIMYFDSEGQTIIINRFHFALNDGGFLFLGKAEMLFSRNNKFMPVDLKQRVFSKVPNSDDRRDRLSMMPEPENEQEPSEMVSQTRLSQAAFNIDPVAQVVVDVNGCLTLANESACTMFGLKHEDLGRPWQDLELSYRYIELRSPIEQAYQLRRKIILPEVVGPPLSGEARYLEIQVIPLEDTNNNILGIKIIFADVTAFKKLQEELYQFKEELEAAYEELQSSNEELETTNEELQSSNEELETTNEELQSSNEELETTNEELQSTNEELQSLNEELHERSSQLTQVNLYLESILTSLRLGVVVVDKELQVHIWNYKAEDLWGLRFDEVRGRHFINLDIGLPVEQLRQPLRACLTKDVTFEEITLDTINRRGRSIQCKVTCTPLKSQGTGIEGVVLLMEELP
ncbi:MAG: PAS domain S-box protein [Aphanothece sp. CMT-3BRIN-NPC111]|jgi:two-component system CheB/CheR fusion protein|nr:PAS domain S-box protein [Aphanothece sp. CMT-3BRIN-NPC111]